MATTKQLHNQIRALTEKLKSAEADVTDLSNRLDSERQDAITARSRQVAAEKRVEESVAHFNDLKERLANAETENQRMRGYIARVQEDDTVREELVAIGEPDGQQQLVPKRKPTRFEAPDSTTDFSARNNRQLYQHGERPKPKHWITY